MDFYIYANSSDNISNHPSNKSSDFTIEFPNELVLQGEWVCALTEFHAVCNEESPNVDGLYVFCDICLDNFIMDAKLPLLRRIQPIANENYFAFYFPYYISVTRNIIKRLRIYILDEQMQYAKFIRDPVRCTLHFKQKKL